jgi:hypothetical protein
MIALTSNLKGFLSETLWNTNRTGGYGNNPQFKPEHGKYNIIIPETGWKAFWSIARESARFSTTSREPVPRRRAAGSANSAHVSAICWADAHSPLSSAAGQPPLGQYPGSPRRNAPQTDVDVIQG